MDLQAVTSDWKVMSPEICIIGTMTLIAILDLFLPKRMERKWLGSLAFGGTFLSFWLFLQLLSVDSTSVLFDTFLFDTFAKGFKFVLLFGYSLLLLLAIGSEKEKEMKQYEMEFYYMLLAALFGGMIITSSNDLLTLFIGLEIVSVSSYVLVGLNKGGKETKKATLTFFINGAIATAMILFGMSYLFGISGTTHLQHLVQHAFESPSTQYLSIVGLSFVFIGLSFKWTTIPFSLWAPDVYQEAETVVTAFLSAFSKAIGLIMLFRIMDAAIEFNSEIISVMQNNLLILALLSMLFGNMMAIGQRNVKRLLAYSSIAHGGYMLAGIASHSVHSTEAVTYYFFVYSIMTVSAFSIVAYMTGGKEADEQSFFGLSKTSPLLATCFAFVLISLAGLPPTVGFIGKWKLLISIYSGGSLIHYVTAAGMIGTTLLSYVYYFGLIGKMFFQNPKMEAKIPVRLPLFGFIVFCVVATFLVGLFPSFNIQMWVG